MKILKLSEIPSRSPSDFIIDGLIFCGEMSLVYGPSGVGKSAIVMDMLYRASAGLTVAGRQTREVDVFWFPTENLAGHCHRLMVTSYNLNGLSKVRGEHYVPTGQLNLLGTEAREMLAGVSVKLLKEKANNNRLQILVVDTLSQAIAGADENGSAAMSEVIFNLKSLMIENPELHVMIVHHSGKKKENGPRGHSSLFAAMDSCFFVSSVKNYSKFENTKQRNTKPADPLKFTLEEICRELDGNFLSSVAVKYDNEH